MKLLLYQEKFYQCIIPIVRINVLHVKKYCKYLSMHMVVDIILILVCFTVLFGK